LIMGATGLVGCGSDTGTVDPGDAKAVQKNMSSGEQPAEVKKGKQVYKNIKNRPTGGADTPK